MSGSVEFSFAAGSLVELLQELQKTLCYLHALLEDSIDDRSTGSDTDEEGFLMGTKVTLKSRGASPLPGLV